MHLVQRDDGDDWPDEAKLQRRQFREPRVRRWYTNSVLWALPFLENHGASGARAHWLAGDENKISMKWREQFVGHVVNLVQNEVPSSFLAAARAHSKGRCDQQVVLESFTIIKFVVFFVPDLRNVHDNGRMLDKLIFIDQHVFSTFRANRK